MAEPIAIVGMSGRFPGADTLDQYWTNLANGVESIAILTPEEMRAAGIPEQISRLPGYVNASPTLDNVDKFDAQFFGFSARDAALTDPQHRLFLETAWHALEDAGYDPARFPGAIGVFGGCELSTYLYHLYQNLESLKYIDGMQLMVTNDKDHLCTQVSYRLNLRGPSVAVQTTCSTSLVAISIACESLHSGRCDMALAGGVTVRVPQRGGYFYSAGSILSPDGHCRPFDAKAQGTIVGSGVGLVVLKRLSDALEQRDNIRAVILGAGVNNDGNEKVGYTAPSSRGQAAAIRAAHRMSGVTAESIGYIEAHGTGTILGDPIEISALTEVFRETTKRRGFCGIGSAKSNFGHLSCAAGVAGLMKTVLAMENASIPPTVHYSAPNPAIDLFSSPFYVTTTLQRWDRNGTPRRAGVSSFGVGGTNAHLVLEEAPQRQAPAEKRPYQVFTISARSEAALNEATKRLGAHLHSHRDLDHADVAYTLHLGRRQFPYRRAVVTGTDEQSHVAEILSVPASLPAIAAENDRPTVFLFPGQGSQYPGMAESLYQSEPVVRRVIDRCARILKPSLGADLRRLLFPATRNRKNAGEALKNTKWAQPALFTVGYALSELWMSWGITPRAMIGHSVGEYVAATLAGVMTLENALALIARRGQLISELPRGSMLAVIGPAEQFEHFLDERISLAAMNAPGFSVLSGPDADIDRVEKELGMENTPMRRLHTSHAFHSCMMDPILREFEDIVARATLSRPNKPFVSTLSGNWADETVTKPEYWSRQLRSSVRFADGMATLMSANSPAGKNPIYLEAGPGNTLSTFATEVAKEKGVTPVCLPSLPGPDNKRSDVQEMLTTLGQLWAHGVEVNWENFHQTERRSRVSLPTYPFERQRYWVGSDLSAQAKDAEVRDPFDWFYRAVWREQPLREQKPMVLENARILVLDCAGCHGAAIAAKLRAREAQVIVARPGERFQCISADEYVFNLAEQGDFRELAIAVCAKEPRLAGVIDCMVSANANAASDFDTAARVALWAPMRLAHALSSQSTVRPLPLLFVASGTTRVGDADVVHPNIALGAGVARVLPQEHPGLRVAHIDIAVDDHDLIADMVTVELAAGAPEPAVALRAGKRFVETFEPVPIRGVKAPQNLPPKPVVLITGGLGHMGLSLGEALFGKLHAKLVLVGRTVLPEPSQWAAKSQDPVTSSAEKTLLERLSRMRDQRDELLVLTADLNNSSQVKAAVDTACQRFGGIDLVIHGAARIDAGAFASAAETGFEVMEAQFSPKLRGLFYLMNAMRGREPKRWVLHSSISTVLGGLGLAAYSGANAMLDAIALQGGPNWLSIDWDAWDNAAEAQSVSMPSAIKPPEGQEVLLRLLGAWQGSRAIVVINLIERLQAWVHHTKAQVEEKASVDRHPRPNLSTSFVEARTETERRLAEIWGSQLGVDAIGIHDRFFDLGGHSLLAAQIASEICDSFQIELPVLKLFQAPTIGELAALVDKAQAGEADETAVGLPTLPETSSAELQLQGNPTEISAKVSYREFYNDVTRRLENSGMGAASVFLNYGYVSFGNGDEAQMEVPEHVFNRNSVRLAFELLGDAELKALRVLDVGCGRGGTAALLAEAFGADATGMDLSPDAIAFCRKTHGRAAKFEVGDAEHLPFEGNAFDAVTNIESSHTYPNLRGFFTEVRRVLRSGGRFFYTDLLPTVRWMEVHALLEPLGFRIEKDRDITANVLASCDEVAASRTKAFGGSDGMIDNFLAVPGSAVYEQMNSGAWEYRILRAVRI